MLKQVQHDKSKNISPQFHDLSRTIFTQNISPNTSNPPRHPELGSGSIRRIPQVPNVEQMLKQVQHDRFKKLFSASFATSLGQYSHKTYPKTTNHNVIPNSVRDLSNKCHKSPTWDRCWNKFNMTGLKNFSPRFHNMGLLKNNFRTSEDYTRDMNKFFSSNISNP